HDEGAHRLPLLKMDPARGTTENFPISEAESDTNVRELKTGDSP
ncbi:MAG: hypothetical protein RIS45_1817, partial [Planctomycetota bacterium]